MNDADDSTHIFEWTPPSAGVAPSADSDDAGVELLMDRALPLVEDRGATAESLTEQLARLAFEWLNGVTSPDAATLAALLGELAPVFEAHGWRGTVSRFRGSLLAIGDTVPDDGGPKLRESLADECSRWMEREGGRIGDKARCGAPLLDPTIAGYMSVTAGETILVHGWSETVVRALELAHARGLNPHVIVSEGGPDLGGRRLARRLVASGMAVRFIYDAALVDAVATADRVWLGTDTIGARTFIGRVGTRAALERAEDLDVPSAVIATTDKILPSETLTLPAWPADEAWHLWEGAPAGVDIESQSFEEVPLALVTTFATERGAWSALEVGQVARDPQTLVPSCA